MSEKILKFIKESVGVGTTNAGQTPEQITDKILRDGYAEFCVGGNFHRCALNENKMTVDIFDLWSPEEPFSNGVTLEISL